MHINCGGVLIEGEQMEEVDEFMYLGRTVSKKGSTDEDIKARFGKARQSGHLCC